MDMPYEKADARTLGVCRAAVYGVWAVVLWRMPIAQFAHLPSEWAVWWGVFRKVPDSVKDALLSAAGLNVLYYSLLALAILLAVGARPFQPLAIVFGLMALLYDQIVKGYGAYTNHAQFVLLYSIWILAFYPCADRFGLFPRRSDLPERPEIQYRAPLFAAPLVLSLAYMFVGIRRIADGGIEIFTGDAMPIYQAVQSLNNASYGNEMHLGLLTLASPAMFALSKIGFFVTTLFEALSPLALFHRGFRLAWIVAMLALHTMAYLTMNISFWENSVLILVFFTPLPNQARRRGGSMDRGGENTPSRLRARSSGR